METSSQNSANTSLELTDISDINEFDDEDQNTDDLFSFGKKVKISLADMDYVSWRDSLKKDQDTLELLTLMVGDITPEHDLKLQELMKIIDNKLSHPINEGNKKVIVFTAFADTARYLYDNVSTYVKEKYGLNTAMVSGSVEGRTTCPKLKNDLNTVLTCFSPISKDKKLLMPNDNTEIDFLIATDCISEGQNLQDCDYLINYDIHWNPVRIIQRFGRIDRIGSKNKVIQLVNFWPDVTLDEYINLKAKVETRMKIVDMTATGDDNLLSDEEKTDLEYRKAQLRRLQDEVVDIEDMTTGISIMDKYRQEIKSGTVAELPDELKPMAEGIHTLIQSVYDDSILQDMFTDGHETKVKDNPLQMKETGNFIGSLKTSAGLVGGGQAQMMPLAFDPTMLFMAAALANIDKKLDSIKEMQQEMMDFLVQKEKAELKGNLTFLYDVFNNYKYNWNNEMYKNSNHTMVLAIKKEAEAKIVFYREQIIAKVNKKSLIHRDQTVNKQLQAVQDQFKDYQLTDKRRTELQTDCWRRKKVFKYRSVENAQSVIMTDAQVEENFGITDYSFINVSPADGTDVESVSNQILQTGIL